jgi:hypothetical protein
MMTRTAIENVLALQQARARVVERIKRAGYKLAETSASEIRAAAAAYLNDPAHREECYARAAEIIERSPVLQKMIAQGERDQARKSNIRNGAQRRRC